ncbi:MULTISPECIES: TRAP transporter large permease subunit [unclassified Minwuia]|jgi:tripartite ATP-independent transporter DctM subunit|uniref:TRAP transporter large permease n=1 Tax=unclassified Minwuia TaxID=2618799 RepID=UPI00247A7529|nr:MULTISPECIES: TRAP transporter large permease subunit [unclassified Minwuia]
MTELGIEYITLLLFVGLLLTIFLGVPLAFALGTVSLVATYFFWGPASLFLVGSKIADMIFNYTLISVPFFLFMANVLAKSGIADDFYDAMYKWMGPLRGGLAIGTVIICALIAAMSGVSAVGVVTMGTIALPAMLKRGYDKNIAVGTILSGGALGQLIPPSLLAIIFSSMANLSVGKMFLAGATPGLLLMGLFIVYVAIRCGINKDLGPPIPIEERRQITLRDKLVSLKVVLPATLLVLGVLGSLFAGIASPTESAAVGAFGSLLVAAGNRRLTLEALKDACRQTLLSSTMVMWIAISSLLFVSVYAGLGGDQFVKDLIEIAGVGKWQVIFAMMLIIFLLGMIMDPVGIIFLTVPIFLPIVETMGFNPIWFGALVIINLEMAYLTPPFGYNLFILKSVAPKSILTIDLYRAVPPFVALQALGLLLCIAFPEIITWLPEALLP